MMSIDALGLPEVPVVEGVAVFCIAHRPPLYRLPDWVTLIDTSGFSAAGNPFQVAEFLASEGVSPLDPTYLANESLLFIEALVKRQRLSIDRVCLLLHRKFVTALSVGMAADNFTNMRLMNDKDVVLSPQLLFGTTPILTSQPIDLPLEVLYQYSTAHSLFDFLHCSELAVRSGALNPEDFFGFCQSKLLIAGPLLGVTPVDLFLHCLEQGVALLRVMHDVRFTSVLASDPYQCRAVSFFLERLLSFHLMQGLHQAGIVERLPGGGGWPMQLDALGWLVTAQDESDEEGIYRVGNR